MPDPVAPPGAVAEPGLHLALLAHGRLLRSAPIRNAPRRVPAGALPDAGRAGPAEGTDEGAGPGRAAPRRARARFLRMALDRRRRFIDRRRPKAGNEACASGRVEIYETLRVLRVPVSPRDVPPVLRGGGGADDRNLTPSWFDMGSRSTRSCRRFPHRPRSRNSPRHIFEARDAARTETPLAAPLDVRPRAPSSTRGRSSTTETPPIASTSSSSGKASSVAARRCSTRRPACWRPAPRHAALQRRGRPHQRPYRAHGLDRLGRQRVPAAGVEKKTFYDVTGALRPSRRPHATQLLRHALARDSILGAAERVAPLENARAVHRPGQPRRVRSQRVPRSAARRSRPCTRATPISSTTRRTNAATPLPTGRGVHRLQWADPRPDVPQPGQRGPTAGGRRVVEVPGQARVSSMPAGTSGPSTALATRTCTSRSPCRRRSSTRTPSLNGKLGLYWGCQDIDDGHPFLDECDQLIESRGRGYYRSMAACRMRDPGSHFCRVCSALIVDRIQAAAF